MKIILVIASAFWCVSVLNDVNATVMEPRAPVQGNPQEPVLEPLNSMNEPLGVKRVRRQGPVTIPCGDGDTTWTVSWNSTVVLAVDSDGNTVTALASALFELKAQCEPKASTPPSVECTTGKGQGKGHGITISCVKGLLQVTTHLVIDGAGWNVENAGEDNETVSDTLLFESATWNVGFRQPNGEFFESAQFGGDGSEVTFPNGSGAKITYSALLSGGGANK